MRRDSLSLSLSFSLRQFLGRFFIHSSEYCINNIRVPMPSRAWDSYLFAVKLARNVAGGGPRGVSFDWLPAACACGQ